VTETGRATPELDALVKLFYDSPDRLGQFEQVTGEQMPPVYRRLLDHDEHMTVTIEAYHQTPVDVQVLEMQVTDLHYSRQILLRRQTDGDVVQFGIVRLTLDFLGAEVRREIESQQAPLGRILIQHNVLRNVRLLALWRIEPADELQALLELVNPETCYGRTALIYCNSVPAVELLEIVAPV
jgi:chorismate-pyruvate lyase